MMECRETELPYMGRKTSLLLEGGERIEVVIHTDGTRDIAVAAPGAEEPEHVIRLAPASACALGALLCAVLESPAPQVTGKR